MKENRIIMPQAVREIIAMLENGGFEAFAVGGCVRDALLGRTPADWDITTSATPAEVKSLFRRTIDTGIQHGTVTVMKDHTGYEITTYRIDGEYEDARHPKEVLFTRNLIEDLKRRDFTINAMAYNDRAGLVDAFDGIGDLERGTIRCVGDAQERFGEDALRMLRAVRFSAQLGFSIEPQTKAAIAELAGNLRKISAERIQTELVKLLVSPHPDDLRTAYELGITAVILPEFDACPEREFILKSLMQTEADKVLRLTMLFHRLGSSPQESAKTAEKIMRRLKFDNDTTARVKKLTAEHERQIGEEPSAVRRALSAIGRELFPYFLKVRRADLLTLEQSERRSAGLEKLKKLTALYEESSARAEAVTVKELAADGSDLIRAGIPQGKKIGEILNALLEEVLEQPEKNKKELLMEIVRENYRGM